MYHMIAWVMMFSAGEPYLDRQMEPWLMAAPPIFKIALQEEADRSGLLRNGIGPDPEDKTDAWVGFVNVMRHRAQGRKVFAGTDTPVP